MTLSTFKALLWLLTLGMGGGLGYTLYDWNQNQGSLLQPRATPEIQRSWLDNVEKPEPPRQEIHPYDTSIEPNFFELVWTGKEKPKVIERGPTTTTVEPPKPKATPIDKLLVVLYIQVDTTQPEYSKALVRYTDATLSRNIPDPVNLMPGDVLPTPHQLWKVESIDAEGVNFARLLDDGEPDPEVEAQVAAPVTAAEGNLIVKVGADGALERESEIFPTAQGSIYSGRAKRFTEEIRPNTFQVGTEDMERIGETYLDILSSEVRHRPYRNPRTGKWEGVEITQVQPNSLAAKHGAKSGDVIKAINGHPVNSTQEAIQYVKNNQDAYTSWDVLVWNSGKERTVTYNVP